jgi:serine/threonine protein kinase
VIKPKRQLTIKQLQSIVKEVLQCMMLMKSLGLVHCDLKPENILFTDESATRVKVIDFGSASFLEQQNYDLLQTKPYRAPEVCFGCNFDYAADVWSLGCIAYELLAGKVLFPYRTVQENLAKALSVNRVYDFKMFQEGRRRKNYINNYGLLAITDHVERGLDPNVTEVVIPLKGFEPFGELQWSKENHNAIDFIHQCLLLDPAKRLRVEEALVHPFLKQKLE